MQNASADLTASGTPFFVAVGLHRPHLPWDVPARWYDLYPAAEDIKLADHNQPPVDYGSPFAVLPAVATPDGRSAAPKRRGGPVCSSCVSSLWLRRSGSAVLLGPAERPAVRGPRPQFGTPAAVTTR